MVILDTFFQGNLLASTEEQQHPTNSSLSGTTRVSWYQKGKTNLDFTEARDDGMTVASAGPYASLHFALDRYRCQHPTTQFFTGPDALPANQPTASKH